MFKFVLTEAEKKVKSNIRNFVKETIDQYSLHIEKEIKKKTIFYTLWSVAGVALLFFNFPKTVFYILSFCMVLFVVYINRDFVKSLRKTFDFINHFDREVKKLIATKITEIEDQSLGKKIGLWLSGKNNRDIEDLAISYFVRSLIQWIKKNKWPLVIRIVTYTVAVLLFKEMFLGVFI